MKERIDRHKNGSIKAKGYMMDGELEGYWEWFRLDGSKLRSGQFKRDQVMQKLILKQCRSSADPDAVLADWQAFLKRQHDLFVQLGLREGTTPDVSVDVLCGAIRDILRGTDHTLQ